MGTLKFTPRLTYTTVVSMDVTYRISESRNLLSIIKSKNKYDKKWDRKVWLFVVDFEMHWQFLFYLNWDVVINDGFYVALTLISICSELQSSKRKRCEKLWRKKTSAPRNGQINNQFTRVNCTKAGTKIWNP